VKPAEAEEIKRHFDVIMEKLRTDIKAIAESVNMLIRKAGDVHRDLNALTEITKFFKAYLKRNQEILISINGL